MALYTKAALYTEVRDLLNDPAPGSYISDTELESWADRAGRNISALTLCNIHTATATGVPTLTESVTTVAATYRYTLTTQFIKIHSVIYTPAATTPFGLHRINPIMLGHGFVTGDSGTNAVPKYYFHFGKSLFLWPAPKGTSAGSGFIKVYGAVCAYDYSHEETYVIYAVPDRLQPLVIDFVLSCAYIKMGKFKLASMHMSNYLAAIEFERKDNYDRKMTPESKDMHEIPTRNVAAKQG